MILIKKSNLYALFIVIVLSTEFYQIEVFGGYLRAYQVLSPLVIITLLGQAPLLAKAGVFWAISSFLLCNFIFSFFSSNPTSSLTSLGLLLANASLSFSVALIIVSNKVSLESIINITLKGAIVGVTLGVIQVAFYKLAGLNLGFSEAQEGQIATGCSPGLKTEANTFAKYLNVVFLLSLPRILSINNNQSPTFTLVFISIGLLTSLTRSVIYSLFVCLVIVYFWYQVSGRGKLFSLLPLKIIGVGGVGLTIFSIIVVNFNEYAAHKLKYFFDTQEILHGGAAGYRLMSQGILWDSFIKNENTLLTGKGWGQVGFSYGENELQAGGSELITALAYGGIIAGALYILYFTTAIFGVLKTIKHKSDSEYFQTREGVMFAVTGLFVTGQLNGSMNAPEYWLVFGMAIAICTNYNVKSG